MATDRLFNQTQGDSLLAILAQIRDGYNSVDGAFSLTSENPLQNKKITGAVTDTIETLGGTAQKSYAIGQYFLANDGYYYVATAAITAGSSNISSSTGGNCSKTCITAAMNNLSSQISNLTAASLKTHLVSQDIPSTTAGTPVVVGVLSNFASLGTFVGVCFNSASVPENSTYIDGSVGRYGERIYYTPTITIDKTVRVSYLVLYT